MSQFSPAIDAFLVKLKATERTWTVDYDGCIRNASCECPMEGVTGEFWTRAPKLLGMSDAAGLSIVDAADQQRHHNPALRAALLDACGLTEPEGAR